MVLEEAGDQGNVIPGLEDLWGMGANFPPMVEIPPDADDETMVELAIALSLQEQVNIFIKDLIEQGFVVMLITKKSIGNSLILCLFDFFIVTDHTVQTIAIKGLYLFL